MRILRSRKDLKDVDLPLQVFGSTLCSRCTDVKSHLRTAGIQTKSIILTPKDIESDSLGSRDARAVLLAILTWQDGLLPLIVTANWDAVLFQDRVEAFLR